MAACSACTDEQNRDGTSHQYRCPERSLKCCSFTLYYLTGGQNLHAAEHYRCIVLRFGKSKPLLFGGEMSVEYHRKLFVRTCNRECWQYLKMYDLAHPYQSATNQPFTYANLTGSELKINFQTPRPNLLSEMYLRWLSRDPHGLFADIKHSDEFWRNLLPNLTRL